MGQRANLLILENRRYSLYYSHWCANTLTRDLFWGPRHALRFVRAQRALDDTDWLDDVWAEGGAVIDCDARLLLLFGGEDILHDVPLRRVYLELLQRVWNGWTIRWAHEGIAELADYVGYPRANVLAPERPDKKPAHAFAPPRERDWIDVVASFRLADRRLQLFPLAGDVEYYLRAGPDLDALRCAAVPTELLPLDEWMSNDFLKGGFHIDLQAETVDYWTASDMPGLPARIARHWPAWRVTWHRDEYEFQLAATDGRLRFPARSRERLRAQLREMLLQEHRGNPVDAVLLMTDEARREGKEVEVNPYALEDERVELDAAERRRIVNFALGE
jgi:hypothetical protein